MTQQQNQPIYIISPDSQRTSGRDAQRNNIMAAKLVAETVRTTLGPKGMDKMLVDSLGDIVVTNDGVTILEQMNIEHPAAKMIVEIAKTQENEVGDGTTTAVIFAGELLKNAEALLDKEIHPTVITKGYRIAAEKSQEILNKIAEDITPKDTDKLKQIAMTAMTGKGAESAKELLADLCVKAIQQVSDIENSELKIDLDNIKIEKKTGAGIEDSELVQGIILDKERAHPAMPTHLTDAKILLLDSPIEIKSSETDAKIQVSDPTQFQSFLDMEEKIIKEMTEKIIKSGANVVICQKGIDDLAQYYLAKNGIYAAKRAKKSDLEKLARATGANIITNLNDLTQKDLGFASKVEEIKVGDEQMTYITGSKKAKALTILIRGGSSHVVDEVERAIKDALGDLSASLKVGKIVAGAGAIEMELSLGLRKFSNSLSGREQLAVLAFADAIEIIPRTLAENAGIDPIDSLTELKAAHENGQKWAGLNVFTGKIMDCWAEGIIEPLKIKTQAIKSASEVAELILRIDDVLASSKSKEPQMPPGGMGMPGMY